MTEEFLATGTDRDRERNVADEAAVLKVIAVASEGAHDQAEVVIRLLGIAVFYTQEAIKRARPNAPFDEVAQLAHRLFDYANDREATFTAPTAVAFNALLDSLPLEDEAFTEEEDENRRQRLLKQLQEVGDQPDYIEVDDGALDPDAPAGTVS